MAHFKPHEFIMGNKNVYEKMDADLLHHLEIIRELAGCPLSISSSFRDEAYCKARNIPYKSTSQHNFGKAVDIVNNFNGATLRVIMYYCLDHNLSFGISKSFIHIDNRTMPTSWAY